MTGALGGTVTAGTGAKGAAQITPAMIAGWAQAAGFSPVNTLGSLGMADVTYSDVEIATALSLTEDESSDPNATHQNPNGTIDYGLWQINSVHADLFKQYQWNDPAQNAKMAYAIYKSQGWGAWSTYGTKAFQDNLTKARGASAQDSGTAPVDTQSPLDQIVNPIKDIAAAVYKAGAWIGDSKNWIRVAEVGIGIMLIVGALAQMAKPAIGGVAGLVK